MSTIKFVEEKALVDEHVSEEAPLADPIRLDILAHVSRDLAHIGRFHFDECCMEEDRDD